MKYYYNKDGKNHGPVTLEELRALAAAGEIQRQTPVIQVGKKEWMRWGALQDSLESEPAEEPAAKPQRPAESPRPATRVNISRAAVVEDASEPAAERFAFIGKITRVYDMIDTLCDKICFLPGGLVDTPEQCKKNLSFLNGIVGIGTLLCVLCLCLGNGFYQNLGLFLGLLLGGAVVQYVCYQMYSAMLPLLFGKKIKLSSLWLPRTLTLVSALLILGCVGMMLINTTLSDALMWLSVILYLAGMAYSCTNCRRLTVDESPEEVVPGREFLNIFRFLTRVSFATLHVLTPVWMLLSALMLLLGGQAGKFPPGMTPSVDHLFFLVMDKNIVYALVISVLPVITLPLFYFSCFIPDFLESFFTAGDTKRN